MQFFARWRQFVYGLVVGEQLFAFPINLERHSVLGMVANVGAVAMMIYLAWKAQRES